MSSFNLAGFREDLSRRRPAALKRPRPFARSADIHAHHLPSTSEMPSSYRTGSIESFADLARQRSCVLSPSSGIELGRSGCASK